ncbi:hypothetical protein IE4771_PB00362 (plasmid) [Rhizobium etli bv. mimosae str. IE4771]|uniref:Uncharacterized protein n=1 Tax=Rhizobium etli bv. mimosae str. IE4771 TaxID=1432050 RepID=A0A060I4W9_RHIET|nr:hypothetical protein IE4771_PB00362 [Rhizobium sp. IE4771]
MRSRVLLLGATTIVLVASGATKAADVERVGGPVRSKLLRQLIRSANLWRRRQVRCHPPAQPAPAVRPGSGFRPGRRAGAPGIAMCLPRVVRAAGGSGAGHRREGRRLNAVVTHFLPAACPSPSAMA